MGGSKYFTYLIKDCVACILQIYYLEILDWHQVTKFGQAIENRVQELSADFPTGQMVRRKTLQDPEVDGEKEVGDVGSKSESGLGRLFSFGLQQLLVQLGPLLETLLVFFALKLKEDINWFYFFIWTN